MAEPSRPSTAELAAIRYLAANPFGGGLLAYYRGNGHLSGHAAAGRRGASERMYGRLQKRGWIDQYGRVSPSGREAAQDG